MRLVNGGRLLCLAGAFLLASCVNHNPQPGHTSAALGGALTALSPTVDPAEANRVAHTLYDTSARLKQEYNVTNTPIWHNFLIKTGSRKRGYCFHWTEDFVAALRPLQLKTLDIHWAVADLGKDTESNAVILTAKGAPLLSGIVVDGWRFGGKLFWKAAATDKSYHWQTDHGAYARRRMAALSMP